MKKITTTILGCLMAAAMMAQNGTMLWDGENYAINSQGGCWDDGSPKVVANPDKTGINISDKCLKFTMTNSSKTVKIPFRDWMTGDNRVLLNGRKRISLMIRKAMDENVMIELSDPTTGGASGYWHKAATWYSGNGQWQKVVFDFSTHDYFNDPGVISITAQTADVSSSQDVYIDNVTVEDLPYANGMKLSEVPFGSLSGAVTLTGLWMHGKCSKVVENTWSEFTYDDFELLASKLTPSVTSVDMRGADVRGAYNVFAGINPNMLIYANAWLDNSIPVADAFNTTRFVETPEYSSMPTYFTPQTGYVGDVMPYYDSHAGEFKVLYLKDRIATSAGTFHPIYMVRSSDLSSFVEGPEILACGDANSQEAHLGTGCMLYDETKGKYYAFYTAERGNGDHSDDKRKQEIFKATSDDGLNWTKQGYVMKAPDGYDQHEFRDPQIYEEDGTYHMLISAMKWNGSANNPVVAHYTSNDLDGSWTLQDPLYTLTDRTSGAEMMECPDLIKIGSKYYIIYSDQKDKVVRYVYSSSLTGPYTYGGELDGNNWSLYAAKTAHYTDGVYDDYYLFGWCTTTKENGSSDDWAGSLITHKLYADENGKLSLTVPHKFEEKFATRADLPKLSQTGSVSLSGRKYTLGNTGRVQFARLKRANRLEINFKANSNTNEVFGFSVRDYSDGNNTRYSFRLNLANQKLYLNKDVNGGGVTEISQKALPRTSDGVYNLKVVQEQSIIVIYVNDKIAFTNRIYNMARNPWSIFCESGTVEVEEPKAWSY